MYNFNIKSHIKYWSSSAAHDYITMSGLYKIKRYSDCLFYGHLVLEKILKSLFVKKTNNPAPRIHNLLRLAEIAGIDISEEQKDCLDIINDFNINSRYPDFKLDFYKRCNKNYTDKNLKNIKLLYKLLCQTLKKL
jgi:HEPN domain-containing protein